MERFQRYDSIRRLRADETGAGEDAGEKLAARRIIVSNQDSFARFLSHPFSLIRNAPVLELYFFLLLKKIAAVAWRRRVQFHANAPSFSDCQRPNIELQRRGCRRNHL